MKDVWRKRSQKSVDPQINNSSLLEDFLPFPFLIYFPPPFLSFILFRFTSPFCFFSISSSTTPLHLHFVPRSFLGLHALTASFLVRCTELRSGEFLLSCIKIHRGVTGRGRGYKVKQLSLFRSILKYISVAKSSESIHFHICFK